MFVEPILKEILSILVYIYIYVLKQKENTHIRYTFI